MRDGNPAPPRNRSAPCVLAYPPSPLLHFTGDVSPGVIKGKETGKVHGRMCSRGNAAAIADNRCDRGRPNRKRRDRRRDLAVGRTATPEAHRSASGYRNARKSSARWTDFGRVCVRVCIRVLGVSMPPRAFNLR